MAITSGGVQIYFVQQYSLRGNLGIMSATFLTSSPSPKEPRYLPMLHTNRNVLLISLV